MDQTIFDIINYLEDNEIPYSTEGKNIGSGWLGTQCPFCQDLSGTHLGINLSSKAFHCFRCGEKGNPVKLVAALENIPQREAVRIVRRYFDPLSIASPREIANVSKIEFPLGISKDFTDAHIKYLESRNFDPQHLINKYDLYAGGMVGDFKFRIVAPIILNQQIVSFIGRDITGLSEKRYKMHSNTLSVVESKKTLYNIDSIKKDAIIVEGMFDVFRIGDGCCATLGTVMTNEQIVLLRGLRNVFILFDSPSKDVDVMKRAEEVMSRVSLFVEHAEIVVLSEGDPAELSEVDVTLLRKELKI